MPVAPEPVPPETRDWTFVLADGCSECGWLPFDPTHTSERLVAATDRWEQALSQPTARFRPRLTTWSPVEYACHVRDMIRLLGQRVAQMQMDTDPQFENWDGDAKAVELNYWAEDPDAIAAEIRDAALEAAGILTGLQITQWNRSGRRSDGTTFTIASLCQFTVHDVEHHLYDVEGRGKSL